MNRCVSDENDSRMVPKDQVGSPSIDESCSGGSLNGGGQTLKKGPWTSAEDTILIEYVKKHGEGNWNAVQKHSGLSRCGKSCRLRWANHLRPNLKKGAITQEEEQLIIELHARMGNKWARMAAYLPGRTDNEIKNFWNTRIKRRQRMGLPLYTSSVCFQSSDDNNQSHTATEYGCSEKQANELFHGNGLDVADVMFDNFNYNPGDFTYTPPFPDIPINSVIGQSFAPQGYGLMNPVVDHGKRCRESETVIPGFHDSVSGILPSFEQLPVEPYGKMQRISSLGYPYDPDPDGNNLAPSEGVIPGSHAFINGNFSASKPLHGPVKLELPSLQYSETDGSSSFASPSTPPYEAFETYVESPSNMASLHCENVSPRNSGLLDALVLEGQVISGSIKQSSEKNSNSSIIIPNSVVENSDPNISGTEWEDYSNPVSPFGCSAASVFNEYTPPISGSSLDVLSHSSAASIEILATSEHHTTTEVGKNMWRPDALLGSAWFEEGSQSAKGHSVLNGALASLLVQDLCTDSKPVAVGTSTALVRGFGLDSYPWHNMPSACQMSEFP